MSALRQVSSDEVAGLRRRQEELEAVVRAFVELHDVHARLHGIEPVAEIRPDGHVCRALTVPEVAELTGLKKHQVYEHVRRKRIRRMDTGDTIRISETELVRWLNSSQRPDSGEEA